MNKWNRSDKIGCLSVILAFIGVIGTFLAAAAAIAVVPEVREYFSSPVIYQNLFSIEVIISTAVFIFCFLTSGQLWVWSITYYLESRQPRTEAINNILQNIDGWIGRMVLATCWLALVALLVHLVIFGDIELNLKKLGQNWLLIMLATLAIQLVIFLMMLKVVKEKHNV
ncbi:MAG: hypothetical protein ACPGWR_09110 [Ardenticatenaceae bacterium]